MTSNNKYFVRYRIDPAGYYVSFVDLDVTNMTGRQIYSKIQEQCKEDIYYHSKKVVDSDQIDIITVNLLDGITQIHLCT